MKQFGLNVTCAITQEMRKQGEKVSIMQKTKPKKGQ